MQRFLDRNTPFPWVKKGQLFAPNGDFSHGSHPCAIHYKDDLFVIAFTRRDAGQRSHIFLCYAEIAEGSVRLLSEPVMALAYGEPGRFDCEGVISVCFVEHGGRIYLYYVGWQNLPDSLWICDTGRAVLDPAQLTLTREFPGPVLGRDKDNPLFAAATAFHVDGDRWMTWYNSGIKWEKTATGWKHYYGIHYAESTDGVAWKSYPGMCLPFADEYEYAFGRPTVFRQESTYFMWFAHRATRDVDTYRIGFASSRDGRNWQRADALSGIDVSPDGWDSEMICYPYVIAHRGTMYMLYNGNGYGRTGFGLAVMEAA
nr:hypothetical protein [uncultured Dongia sp.]